MILNWVIPYPSYTSAPTHPFYFIVIQFNQPTCWHRRTILTSTAHQSKLSHTHRHTLSKGICEILRFVYEPSSKPCNFPHSHRRHAHTKAFPHPYLHLFDVAAQIMHTVSKKLSAGATKAKQIKHKTRNTTASTAVAWFSDVECSINYVRPDTKDFAAYIIVYIQKAKSINFQFHWIDLGINQNLTSGPVSGYVCITKQTNYFITNKLVVGRVVCECLLLGRG